MPERVAQRLTTAGSDQAGLVPLVDAARAALGRKPRELSADAGFCRESNLEALADRRIRGYLAPGRGRHGSADPSGQRPLRPGSRMARMAVKLKRAGRRSRYRWRKQTVEPVIGQIKQARDFRQLLLRGFGKAAAEWALVCTAHNLVKLLAARAFCAAPHPRSRPSHHAPRHPSSASITSILPPLHFPDRLLAPLGAQFNTQLGR